MADRYPLVYNPSANQLQELQSGDSLDIGNASLKNVAAFVGVLTATSFSGDGSNLTNLPAGATPTLDAVTTQGSTTTNSISVGDITAVDATFTGNVSIAGTITYDDVTHVDSQGIGTFRQGINVVGHSEIDTLRASGIATFQSNVHLADNVKLNIGTGDDLQIYHDGSHSYIRDFGTGNLRILAGHLDIKTADGNNHMIVAHNGAAVTLYHNGSEKLATTGYGATVTGDLQVSGSANVGSAITMYASAGIVSATAFYGDGSKLTGVAAAGGGALDITSCLFI